MKIETGNDELMAISAHRYCLGRASYIVSLCIEWLNAHWDQLTPKTKFVILRDTIQAIATKTAGQEIDERDWRRFVISRDITESERIQLMDSLKSWPAAIEFLGRFE